MPMDFSMNMGSVYLIQPYIETFLDAPGGAVDRDLRRRANRVLRGARRQVGKDTRSLWRSLTLRREFIGGFPEYWIGSENSKAYVHHEGTRPHLIHPRKAQALRYQGRGGPTFSKVVFHPGTKPNRYLSDNLKLARL